jgi:hypothetical protein
MKRPWVNSEGCWYHSAKDEWGLMGSSTLDYSEAGYPLVICYRPEICINANGWMTWHFKSKQEAVAGGWRKICKDKVIIEERIYGW